MSQQQHDEHGTMQSYVVGFILSLLFTFIPYYLVVNKIITGKALLITILGFALIQMLIQIIFFLHLGRGPKPNWNLYFFASTVGIILVVVGGSVFIMNNLHYNMMPSDQVKKLVNDEGIYQVSGEKTGACQGQNTNHRITIEQGQASPSYTVARKCDTLTFTNKDDTEQEIIFGAYNKPATYAGESELVIRKGKSKTITLSESGSHQFYSLKQGGIVGYFTVVQ